MKLLYHRKTSKIMPVKREVYSVNIQMILSLIPFVDLWAAHRIEKLTLWLLLWVGMFVMGFGVGMAIPNPTSSFIVSTILGSIIAVVLMRHFTMEWNENILNERKDDKNEEEDTETRYRLD